MHITHPWARRLAEFLLVLALLVTTTGLTFVSAWLDSPSTGIAALLVGAFLVLALLGRGILSLTRHEWVGAIVRILAAPACFIIGLAAMFFAYLFAQLGGGVALEQHFESRTLPVNERAMSAIQAEGNKIAASLSEHLPNQEKLALHLIGLESSGPGGMQQKISLDFFKSPPGHFSISADFQKGSDGWKRTSQSASGDPETFEKFRNAIQPNLPAALPPEILWPADDHVTKSIRAGAEELRAVFEKQDLLRSNGKPWSVDTIRYLRNLRDLRNQTVRITFSCKDGKKRIAWAHTDWAFCENTLHFLDATGGTENESNMENHAEVETVVTEWLSSDRGIFERLKPRGKPWRTCEAILPDGVSLIYAQQQAHLFLAEYDMRATINLPDGRSRTFALPMNTGGRTNVLVFTGTSPGGTAALRLASGRHFDMAFDLVSLRIFPVGEFTESAYAGAFQEVSTPLTWFPAAP